MKNIIWIAITVSFILLSLESIAQYRWEWAKCMRSNSDTLSGLTEGWPVSIDRFGHVYACGASNGTYARFDTFNYVNPYGSTSYFSYLLKYDTSGKVLSAFFFRSDNFGVSEPSSIVTDSFGNVYLAGFYATTPMYIGAYTLSSSGGVGDFMIKLDSTGNVIWAKKFNVSGYFPHLALDHSGHIYFASCFTGSSVIIGHDTLRNSGTTQAFWTKMDTSGNIIWAKATQSDTATGSSSINAIAIDESDNVILTGSSSSRVYFDTIVLPSNYNWRYSHLYLAKYSPIGNILWAKSPSGVSHYTGYGMSTGWGQGDYGYSIAVDNNSNIYASGAFSVHHICFDSDTLFNSHEGGNNMYLAKLDSTGNTIWAKKFIAGNPYCMLLDSNYQNLWMSGALHQSIGYFDADTVYHIDSPTFAYSSIDGSFIAKFDTSGNTSYVTILPRGGDDDNQIAVDGVGNIYFCGDYYSNACDTFIVGGDTMAMVAAGSENFFIAKLAGPWVRPTDTTHGDTTHHLGLSYPIRKDLLIYPNPNNGLLTIEHAANCEVALYDVTGRVLLRAEISTDKQVLNISALPMGVYAVDIIDEATGTKVVRKLLKE